MRISDWRSDVCSSDLTSAPASAQDTVRQVPATGGAAILSFAPVVKKASPAVVNIVSKRKVEQRAVPSLLYDPFFRRFFGDGFGDRQRREREQSSLGSGVIVAGEGFIVTNEHVIKGASEIKVVLADRREFEAELVLRSEEHTSELQSLMRISYAVFCLKQKNSNTSHSQSIYRV